MESQERSISWEMDREKIATAIKKRYITVACGKKELCMNDCRCKGLACQS